MVKTNPNHSWVAANSDLQAVYEHARTGICTLDHELICVRINDTLAASQGSRDSAIGLHLKEALPRLAPLIEASVLETLSTGRPITNIEFSCLGSNSASGILTYLADLVPVFGDHSTVGVCCVFREVSQQRKNEQQLLLSKFSVDTSQNMIFWIKQDSSFFYVNDAAASTLGYSKDELCSMTVSDIDSDYANNRWVSYWKEVRQQKSLTFESTIKRKDGELIPVKITTNFLEFEGEEYVFAFVLDLEEHKQAQSALKESETLFKNVVETAKFGVQVCSLDGRITFANQALGDIYECDPQELIGRYVWELCQSGSSQHDAMVRVAHGATDPEASRSYQTQNVTLKGKEITVEINWTYDLNWAGDIVGFVVIVSDITERTQSRKKLEASEARFRALVENNNDVFNLFNEAGELIYARLC